MPKGHIRVSEELQAFIEREFQSMLGFENERKEDRGELRRKEQAEHKKAKRSGNIQIKRLNPVVDMRKFTAKGKVKYDFNNFVFMCVYLLEKKRWFSGYGVYSWISEFLTRKGYKKNNEKGKPYNSNDIKRIVHDVFGDATKHEIIFLPFKPKGGPLFFDFGKFYDSKYNQFLKMRAKQEQNQTERVKRPPLLPAYR